MTDRTPQISEPGLALLFGDIRLPPEPSGLAGTTFDRSRNVELQGYESGTLVGGKYRILHQIGSGAIAYAYLAEHNGAYFSLKVFRNADSLAAKATERRYLPSIKASEVLTSDNFPKLHGIGIHEDHFYTVAEYIHGVDLQKLLEISTDGIAPSTMIPLAIQICFGLDTLARNELVHRDIKPANLIVTPEGTVKICDFEFIYGRGVSKLSSEVGSAIGTPLYMSPEQIELKLVDARTDIYGFGCTMYECLTKRGPFDGKPAAQILKAHLHESAEPPSKYNQLVTPGLDQVVLKCLEKDPNNRYQSAVELMRDLESLLTTAA